MNQQAERRVGTIIGGKWRVDALLGSGSMAAVYAVTHRNGARAALKILHPTLCTDPAVCERFLGEGYLANSVKHPGIVRVLDDGVTDDGCVFLTMDLLEGDTLEGLRQRRGNRIPLVEALDLGDKLMDILSAVHAAGIIHRDLKPQNVFVCDDGAVKLLDFGVARVFDRTSQSKLSMFGLVLGTPSFMSPEQALGSRDKVDHRSDIWSFGATIFTALTGETVHLGVNVQAKLLAAATVKARSITMVMPDLPAAIAAPIDTALRFKKEDRWQSVDAMRRALREAREASGLGRAPEAARPFDISLDESTDVDKGSGKSNPPPPQKTVRMRQSEPPEGPSGTFIGMGDGAAKVGNDGSVPPPPTNVRISVTPPAPATGGASAAARGERAPKSAPPPLPGGRPRAPSMPNVAAGGTMPTATPLIRNAQPHPAAVVKRMPVGEAAPINIRASRPDAHEGSIPAYGNTLNFGADESISDADINALGVRRRGSVAVWLMAVMLAAAALGGIAFFAVKRSPGVQGSQPGPDRINTQSPPVPTSPSTAEATPTTRPTTTGLAPLVIGDPIDTRAGAASGTKDAESPTPPVSAPPPLRPVQPAMPWRPPPPAVHAPTRPPFQPTGKSPEVPTATTEPTKPTPPGLAPDPFGTPD